MTIPILANHDRRRIIGRAVSTDDGVSIEVLPPHQLPTAALFDAFGDVGIRIDEAEDIDGITHVRRFTIEYWSIRSTST